MTNLKKQLVTTERTAAANNKGFVGCAAPTMKPLLHGTGGSLPEAMGFALNYQGNCSRIERLQRSKSGAE